MVHMLYRDKKVVFVRFSCAASLALPIFTCLESFAKSRHSLLNNAETLELAARRAEEASMRHPSDSEGGW
jgi:hypothetical protein